ncbi:MAG: acyltransferase family protein [Deltaproteobacteria bacterium]|nr:acyltransferase family protein [Deltaproteobacteria bacterium]
MLAGLGIFVFVSGYALDYTNKGLKKCLEVLVFFKKRLLRVFPLYIPSLLLFVLLFHYLDVYHEIVWGNPIMKIAIHSIGAQVLFSLKNTPIFTLWFVGLIVLYYIVYVVVTYQTDKTKSIVARASMLFFLCVGLRQLFDLLDTRFFLYYAPFVVGIIKNRIDFSREDLGANLLEIFSGIIFLGSSILICSQRSILSGMYNNDTCSIISQLPNIIVLDVFMISGLFVGFRALQLGVKKMSDSVYGIFRYVSSLSYVIYLFHRPVLAIITFVCLKVFMGIGILSSMTVILLGIPLLLIVSKYIQTLESRFMRKR